MNDISANITTVREQLTRAATGTMTPSDKENVAVLMKELKDNLFQSMNMTMGDRYIFGGFNTNSPPFTMDGSGNVLYNGIDLTDTTPANMTAITDAQNEQIMFEIGFSMSMDLSFTGVDMAGVGDDNVFKVMDNIIAELTNGNPDDAKLSLMIGDVSQLQDNLMENIVRVGSRSVKLDMLENRYSQDIISYESIKSNIEDIDQAEAIMLFKMAETVYRQSLSTGARIIQPTLMDYLR